MAESNGDLVFQARVDLTKIEDDIKSIQKRFDSKPISLKLKIDESSIREIQQKIEKALSSVKIGVGIGGTGVTGSTSNTSSPMGAAGIGLGIAGISSIASQSKSISQLSATHANSISQLSATIGAYTMGGSSCPNCGNVVGGVAKAGIKAARYINGYRQRDMNDLYDLNSVTAASMDARLSGIHSTMSEMGYTGPSAEDIGVAVESARQFPYNDDGSRKRKPKRRKPKGGGGIGRGIIDAPLTEPNYAYASDDTTGFHTMTTHGHVFDLSEQERTVLTGPKSVSEELAEKGRTLPKGYFDAFATTPLGRGLSGSGPEELAEATRRSPKRPYGARSRQRGSINIGDVADGIGALGSNIGRDISRFGSNVAGGIDYTHDFIIGSAAKLQNSFANTSLTSWASAGSMAAFAGSALHANNQFNIGMAASSAVGNIHSMNQAYVDRQNNSPFAQIPLAGQIGLGLREAYTGDQQYLANQYGGAEFQAKKNMQGAMLTAMGNVASAYSIGGGLRIDAGMQQAGVFQRGSIVKKNTQAWSQSEQEKNSNKALTLEGEADQLLTLGSSQRITDADRKKAYANQAEASGLRNANKAIQRQASLADSSQDKLDRLEAYSIRRQDKRNDTLTASSTSRITTAADAMGMTADNKPFQSQIRSAQGNYAANIRDIEASDMKPEAKSIAIAETNRLNKETMREIKHQITMAQHGGTGVDLGRGISFAGASTRETLAPEDLNVANKAADAATKSVDEQDKQSHKNFTQEGQETRKIVNENTPDYSKDEAIFSAMEGYLKTIATSIGNVFTVQ